MKLLASPPQEAAALTELIKTYPKKQIVADSITDQTGVGQWFVGRVYFISNEEVVIVPTRCRATNVFGAASRMPRAAKTGLPKKMRRGKNLRIHSVLVEMVERERKN